ncbi:hypothetical protein NEOLI_001160 [Neolecta irregularis DAH-3]|uniref:Uncharacterized protein n=1 Tax=Neolecta irregularis (strain DAH-3) TaxID=1198029 RepID=A0A1U7LS55_NEOID|nr:hypothetical protein NEOLI_001160 [Neolecta irregularis DAH-3]|eukprot:OLL25459.1 hypothetical protein NEOLI_001160 [Neolecta irregularis DAH-3]
MLRREATQLSLVQEDINEYDDHMRKKGLSASRSPNASTPDYRREEGFDGHRAYAQSRLEMSHAERIGARLQGGG